MCLTLKSNHSKPLVAEEDICVFKVVEAGKFFYEDCAEHGDEFTGVIVNHNGENVKCSGKISFYYGNPYFCTNEPSLDGSKCEEKFGYQFSWILATSVKSIIVKGKECMLEGYQTPYQHFNVRIGETYTSVLNKINDRIERGLHSYGRLEDARSNCGKRYVLIECTIPKGSTYYVGTFNDELSYASDTLRYDKLCVLQ